MKTFSKLFLAVALIATIGFFAMADRNVPVSTLPSAAKTFINKHYSDAKAYYCEKEGSEYDVDLSNGVDLKFNKKGKLIKIESDRGVIAQSVLKAILPAKAVNHLNSLELFDQVDEVEFRRNTIVVELKNYDDYEIRFNLDGSVK
ncbi:MAG: PepSY-like domain-containing protein [Muribaculaceae bacterium]|nr:PepSY-like domain-containing protein [Muribaculaceae bacterium]